MTIRSERSRIAGFTLVELMVTILVASILVAIAVPSFSAQVRKSRRVEARSAILDLATREERYFAVNNSYTDSALSLGYSATEQKVTAMSVGSNYYQVTITPRVADPTTTPPTQPGFKIDATAVGNQTKDTQCRTFTVTEKGAQTATNSAAAASTDCW